MQLNDTTVRLCMARLEQMFCNELSNSDIFTKGYEKKLIGKLEKNIRDICIYVQY
jgi:hypothetical protein